MLCFTEAEVGTATAMAAAGLMAVLNGTPRQAISAVLQRSCHKSSKPLKELKALLTIYVLDFACESAKRS